MIGTYAVRRKPVQEGCLCRRGARGHQEPDVLRPAAPEKLQDAEAAAALHPQRRDSHQLVPQAHGDDVRRRRRAKVGAARLGPLVGEKRVSRVAVRVETPPFLFERPEVLRYGAMFRPSRNPR